MDLLPTLQLGSHTATRLICGGNPFAGFSHVSGDLDWEMIRYHTMAHMHETLDECWRQGINTVVARADRLMMRLVLEHHERGGQMQWIAQLASEVGDYRANVREAARYGAIAIFHHGTVVDNAWHTGRMEEIRDVVKAIKDAGYPAGIASHIPEVIAHAEDQAWETDFYMGCFYNLARELKSAPATDRDAYARDAFPAGDPPRMAAVLRSAPKPCLGYKILAASRRAGSREHLVDAFRFAFNSLKPADAVVVGMYQKHKNQVAENAQIVRELLAGR